MSGTTYPRGCSTKMGSSLEDANVRGAEDGKSAGGVSTVSAACCLARVTAAATEGSGGRRNLTRFLVCDSRAWSAPSRPPEVRSPVYETGARRLDDRRGCEGGSGEASCACICEEEAGGHAGGGVLGGALTTSGAAGAGNDGMVAGPSAATGDEGALPGLASSI